MIRGWRVGEQTFTVNRRFQKLHQQIRWAIKPRPSSNRNLVLTELLSRRSQLIRMLPPRAEPYFAAPLGTLLYRFGQNNCITQRLGYGAVVLT